MGQNRIYNMISIIFLVLSLLTVIWVIMRLLGPAVA